MNTIPPPLRRQSGRQHAQRPDARLAGVLVFDPYLLTALGCESDDHDHMRDQVVRILERMTALAR